MRRTSPTPFPIGWFIRLAILRLATQWRSILTIIVGILLVAVIGASVPLYTTAISQVGMIQRIDQNSPEAIHIHSKTTLNPSSEQDVIYIWDTTDNAVKSEISSLFGPFSNWVEHLIGWGETAPLLVTRDDADLEKIRVRIAYYEASDSFIDIVDGRLPTETVNENIDLEIALHENAAAQMNLSVGDVITLDQRGWDTSKLILAQVVGIIKEKDPSASYWIAPSPLRVESSAQWRIETNLLTTRASVERISAEFIPQTRTQIGWRIFFDHTQLPFTQVPAAIAALKDFQALTQAALIEHTGTDLSLISSTELDSILSSYQEEVKLLNIPFSILLLQLGILVLFFLLVMGTLVRRSERREIAMLQSRGALNSQIIILRSLETLFICILAALIAPFIAQQLLVWFIPIFTEADHIPLLINSSAYFYAVGATLVAWVILTLTLIPVLRQPLILAGSSGTRSTDQTWWQKYYLDLLLLVIGLAALWRLTNTRSVLAETNAGGAQADPLLLIGPTLLFFAFGSILLRVFPALMNMISKLLAGRKMLEGTLAGWQVSREPLYYGQIAFLLALVISIGWFAISFQTTIVNHQDAQTNYQVGSSVRIMLVDSQPSIQQADFEQIHNIIGVESYTVALRLEDVNASTNISRANRGVLLGLETSSFQDTVLWDAGLGSIIIPQSSTKPPVPGRELPFIPEKIGFWARLSGISTFFSAGSLGAVEGILPFRLANEVYFNLKLRDNSGTIYTVSAAPNLQPNLDQVRASFGAESEDTEINITSVQEPEEGWINDGWVYFEGDLETIISQAVSPLRLEGLIIGTRSMGFNASFQTNTNLQFDALILVDGTDAHTSLDWFTPVEWEFINEVGTFLASDIQASDETFPEAETNSISLEWYQEGNNGIFGLLLDYPEITSVGSISSRSSVESEPAEIVPLPALVSSSFAAANNLVKGQQFQLFADQSNPWLEVTEIVDYFPTLYGDQTPFVVVDRDTLVYTLQRRPNSSLYPAELWVKLSADADEQSFVEQFQRMFPDIKPEQIFTLSDVLNGLQTDLLTIGLIGLLFLSFLIGLALSIASLMTYSSLSVQSRRMEFAVLRALGFSNSRLVFSIVIEQSLVVLTGMVLGLLIGVFLSTQVLPTLSMGAGRGSVTPPFLISLNLESILQYILIILAIMGVELLVNSLFVRRLAGTQVSQISGE